MTYKTELTPKEASRITGYSIGHIRWLARNGKVSFRRIGERVLLIDAKSLALYTDKMRDMGTQKHAPQ